MESKLYNIEAEQAILGTIIMNNDYYKRIADSMKPEYFYEPCHAKIYAQIAYNMETINIISDQVTLKQFFESDALLKEVGGISYLSTLLASASMIVDIRHYATVVRNLWKRRDLIEIANKLESSSYEEVSAELRRRLDEHDQSDEFNLTHISQAVSESLNCQEEILRFGYSGLDEFLGGIDAGNLIIVAGRPSMGKTTFSVNLAVSAANQYFTIFFSFEVKERAIARKVVSNLRSYSTSDIKQGRIAQSDKDSLVADKYLKKLQLYIYDKPQKTTARIRSVIARAVKKGLKMVFIDYLGMIPCDKKSWSKANEIETIVNELKAFALEFNIVIVLLSQLNRGLEGRTSHKPVLSDLRDSGAIEQTADVVLFVHREEYYLSKAKPFKLDEILEWERDMQEVKGKSQIIVAKNRDGNTGEVEMLFDGKFSRFSEIN